MRHPVLNLNALITGEPTHTAGQRLSFAAAALAVATIGLFGFYHYLGDYGPHAAVLISWLSAALALSALAVHGSTVDPGWRYAAAAIVLGSAADTLLIVIGRPGDYRYPPILLGYTFCYAAGAMAIYRIIRRWPAPLRRAAILDSATLAIALMTVLVSVSTRGLLDETIPVTLRAAAIAFPMMDAILASVFVRIWFAQRARVPAAQVLTTAMFFLVMYHVIALLGLQDPTLIDPRWNETWVLTFVSLSIGIAMPSAKQAMLHLGEASTDVPRVQMTAIAASLAVPYLLVAAYALAGKSPPWSVLAVGGLAISGLVTLRVYALLMDVHARADHVEKLADADPLTGAPNRRRWDTALAAATGEAAAGRSAPFWVAMMDLDRFKQFNDEHGHQAGDIFLERAVRAWQAELGPDDLLARYGGEEFAILVNEGERDEVLQLLDRVRLATPDQQTCSIGVARWQPGITDHEILRKADVALYAAKRLGRDRVITANQRLP